MIIQTAPAGAPRLAVMMHEHTALSGQFARAFGNDHFEPVWPHDLMFFIVSHHDAGWAEFDRDPVTDERTGLPYNLVETPVEYITITSRAVARFQRAAPPLLRADIEHAQLGPLQRALWALGLGPDRQNSASGSTFGRAYARWRNRSAEKAQSRDRQESGDRIEPHQHQKGSGWPSVLRITPTQWESFRLVAT